MSDWKRFESKQTEVLIDYFQNAENDENIKDDAFHALCFRFRSDLLKICEIICKRKGHNEDVAAEIVVNTFKKYYKTRCFKVEETNKANMDDCFLVYLSKIANNELINWWKKEQKRIAGQLYDGTEEIVTELPKIDVEKLDLESKLIHETLLSFPKSHQTVYLTYKAHEKEGVNLPRELQAKLRKYLGGISQVTVRTYKKEVTDKLEEVRGIINKINQQS